VCGIILSVYTAMTIPGGHANFFMQLLAHILVCFATGASLYGATAMGLHQKKLMRSIPTIIGLFVSLVGFVVFETKIRPPYQAKPPQQPASRTWWAIATAVCSIVWGYAVWFVSTLRDATPLAPAAAVALGRGAMPGDDDFVLWAGEQVRTLRAAGDSALVIATFGSLSFGAACIFAPTTWKSTWRRLILAGTSFCACLMGALAPGASVVYATRKSTVEYPFPVFDGDKGGSSFVLFSGGDITQVDYTGVRPRNMSNWFGLAAGFTIVHALLVWLAASLS
jgi:hypothetical protein